MDDIDDLLHIVHDTEIHKGWQLNKDQVKYEGGTNIMEGKKTSIVK